MAKPAQQVKISLNLLYPQGIPLKLPVRLFKWLLSFGRYIGIIVEILVLVTFAARFKLDADLAEVNEKINQQIPYVENLSPQADSIKQTQFKLSVVKKNLSSSPDWKIALDKIAKLTPKNTSFNSLNLEPSKVGKDLKFRINGVASTNNELALLLNGLKNDPILKDINLANLSFDEAGLLFTITGATK